MKIALTSRYARKAEMVEFAVLLQGIGFEVTSSWFTEGRRKGYSLNNAQQNLNDIDAADVLVCFAENPDAEWPRGGRHADFGYALAKGKLIVVIQPHMSREEWATDKRMPAPEHIYHLLPQVVRVQSPAGAVSHLYRLREAPAPVAEPVFPFPEAEAHEAEPAFQKSVLDLTMKEFFTAYMTCPDADMAAEHGVVTRTHYKVGEEFNSMLLRDLITQVINSNEGFC